VNKFALTVSIDTRDPNDFAALDDLVEVVAV